MKTSKGKPEKKSHFDSFFIYSFIKLLQFLNFFFYRKKISQGWGLGKIKL